MINKLRARFVILSMLSVFCVLLIIMSAINISNYVSAADKADELASYIAENNGRFPSPFPNEKPSYKPSGTASDSSTANGSSSGSAPPEALGNRHGFTPETPFETRFFTVSLNSDGSISETNLGSIFAVTTEEAEKLSRDALSRSAEKGYSGSLRYLISEADSGGKLLVFIDNSRELSTFRSFLRSSLLVSAGGILAVFILVLSLSRRVIRPIAESYEKQKRFITDASHELKTPLTVIDASAEVIALEQGESDWTKTIRAEVKRLTELTNSLVALSRMDEDESRLLMTDFSLSDAVEESAEPLSALASSHGLTLETKIEKNLSYYGCETALRQLVSILLDNAIKYSAPGGSIALSLKKQGRSIILTCKNPVDFIEKGAHDELFRRFYRADDSRSSETGGFGIGLSLARATVEAHKGKINAHSDDGRSLTLTVIL